MGGGGARYRVYPSGRVSKRYAPYVESFHSKMLENAYARIVDLDDNPPPKYEMGDKLLDAFFGTGYLISSYPAIYDMCGKSIAGLDIDAAWIQMFESIHGHDEIPDAATATADDERDGWMDAIGSLNIAARDSNTISSSSYVVAKTLYEREYLRRTTTYRTNLQFLLLDNKAHETSINFQKKTVAIYAIMMKYYYDSQTMADKQDYRQEMKETIWPLTTRNYFTGLLNAMSRAPKGVEEYHERIKRSLISKMQYTVSEAIKGAAVGFAIQGPYGAAVGAAIGTAIGEAQLLREQGNPLWFMPFIMGPESAWLLDEDARANKYLPIFLGPEISSIYTVVKEFL